VRRLLREHELVLLEAALVERLRRSAAGGSLHPRLLHAPLVREEQGRNAMRAIYRDYFAIAEKSDLPLLVCAPTWRANRERVAEASPDGDLNADGVAFMKRLRDERTVRSDRVMVGGLIGCRNDCYRPEEGLAPHEAEEFHAWQLERLAGAGADFVMGSTLPALPEAIGIARAMARTGIPYLISFVIDRSGAMLDGTSLDSAARRIDEAVPAPPLGYMINCAHPSFFHPDRLGSSALGRMIGFQANASSLDHHHLDGASELHVDDVDEWAARMVELNRRYGVTILGGCCGTDQRHLEAIVRTAML